VGVLLLLLLLLEVVVVLAGGGRRRRLISVQDSVETIRRKWTSDGGTRGIERRARLVAVMLRTRCSLRWKYKRLGSQAASGVVLLPLHAKCRRGRYEGKQLL